MKTVSLAAVALAAFAGAAQSRDDGQWRQSPPEVRQWFQALRQPDNPRVSCCGDADAVEADEWRAQSDGAVLATVTNGRGYVPDGTVIMVPAAKIKQDAGNPTGHAILFLSRDLAPYCFVIGAGI